MAAFEWPSHNLLTHTGIERDNYNFHVKDTVNCYLRGIAAVKDLYNTPDVQRYVFENTETKLRTNNGLVLTIYKLPIPYYEVDAVPIILNNLRPLITHASKVNVSLGFIHSTANLYGYAYKYASNNTQLVPESLTILRDDDLQELAKYMEPLRAFDRITNNFLRSYRFSIVGVFNVQITVWHAEQYHIGCNLGLMKADRARMQKHCIWTFPREPNDDKCFFRALAAHKTQKAIGLQKLTNDLWTLALANDLCMPAPNERFVNLAKTKELEEFYEINIRWHSLSDDLPPITFSNNSYESKAHILQLEEHCALITDVHEFFEQFFCERCKRLYADRFSLCRHRARCGAMNNRDGKRWKYVGGPEQPRICPFEMLKSYNIQLNPELKFTKAFVAFDIECMLQKPGSNAFTAAKQQYILTEHIPISIAVAYSDDEASVENPECFVSDGDPADLVEKFVAYLLQISKLYRQAQEPRYRPLLDSLDARIETVARQMPPQDRLLANVEDDTPTKSQLRRAMNHLRDIKQHVERVAFQLPVIGYNSSSYDLNAMRAWLIPSLNHHDRKLNAVKRRNRYLVFSTEKFKFMDMYLFMSANTSLKNFIKAMAKKSDLQNSAYTHKLEFPYEYVTKLSVLDDNGLPEDKYWTESVSKFEREQDEQIREQMLVKARERRACAQKEWDDRKHTRFREYLITYNKADVTPFVKSSRNYIQLYRQMGFDLLQYSTLPSLAKQIALSKCPKGAYFERFPAADADIYHQIRDTLYGGAALVWMRLAEAGITKIRPHEFGERAEFVQRVIGLDMTACYLWATCQEHPTGPYFVRHATDKYKITNGITNIQSVLAIEYYVKENYGAAALEQLTHRYRGGETQIITNDYHVYSVDGYLKLDDGSVVIIEYNGCYYHNHEHGCKMSHTPNLKHNKRAEAARLKSLRASAKHVEIIHECDWLEQLDTAHVKKFIKTRPLYQTWATRGEMTQGELIALIMDDKMKGLFEIAAYVPKTHRHLFADLSPFYYQDDIAWDMIGPTMQGLLESVGRKFQSRRMLVNAPFCEHLVLPHQYIKWLVNHGIIIDTIHKVIEFPMSSSPFYELGELICRERQKAARKEATESEKAAADLWKLIGNSIYGQFCMQPENFSKTLYVDAATLKKDLYKKAIRAINPLSDDFFEMTIAKTPIQVRQCPQMGHNVYTLSKLRMLDFGYGWIRMMERSKFSLILTDTDSYYVALAHQTWEECVRANVTAEQVQAFKTDFFSLTPEQTKYRGLFHIEFTGSKICVLQPKLYIAEGDDSSKVSARGVDKKENTLTYEAFRKILLDPPDLEADKLIQKSFRVMDNSMTTVCVLRTNITSFYIKRCVLPNMIDTEDLHWHWPEKFNM